jgi:hypothetical protein
MGAYCSKAEDAMCGAHGCGFSCQCKTCAVKAGEAATSCDCSCQWLVVSFARFHKEPSWLLSSGIWINLHAGCLLTP